MKVSLSLILVCLPLKIIEKALGVLGSKSLMATKILPAVFPASSGAVVERAVLGLRRASSVERPMP